MNSYFIVTIRSNNNVSLNKFIRIFIKMSELHFNFTKKLLKNKKKKKKFTILKSPHVNKSAQEQFEINTYYKQFKICTTQKYKFLVFLKRLNDNILPEVHCLIKWVHHEKSVTNFVTGVLNPTNFIISKNKKSIFKKRKFFFFEYMRVLHKFFYWKNVDLMKNKFKQLKCGLTPQSNFNKLLNKPNSRIKKLSYSLNYLDNLKHNSTIKKINKVPIKKKNIFQKVFNKKINKFNQIKSNKTKQITNSIRIKKFIEKLNLNKFQLFNKSFIKKIKFFLLSLNLYGKAVKSMRI